MTDEAEAAATSDEAADDEAPEAPADDATTASEEHTD